MRQLLLGLFFGLLVLSACREDEFMVTTTTELPDPVVFRETEVFGRVMDKDGRGIPDVAVNWLDGSTVTDQLGVFRVRAGTNQRVEVLRLSHPEYFDVSRRLIIPPGNRIKRFRQILHSTAANSGSFVAATGGNNTYQNGLRISFPPNAIATLDGQAYDGPVRVATHYLDPTLPDLQEQMPGNLLATDADEETRYLRSFGMSAVELSGPGGEPLQLSAPVEIRWPVPADLLGEAPATLPLWYFDETDALWKEEGSAVLEGSDYVGTVSHFTWWNCDVPGPWVFLEIQFAPAAEAAGLNARLTSTVTGTSANAFIDAGGYAAGYVPGGEALQLAVTPLSGGACNFPPNAALIGPFDEDTYLNDQPVNITFPSNIDTLTAKGINCTGNAISLGYALVTYTDENASFPLNIEEVYPLDSAGCLRIVEAACSAAVTTTVQVVDLEAGLESDPVTVDWTGTISLGALPACNTTVPDITQFVLNGDTIKFYQTTVTLYNDPASDASLVTISAYDFAVDGQVLYEITLRKWALSSFLWQVSAVAVPSGNTPPDSYFIDGSGTANSDVTISAIDALPGEQVDIEITNIIISDPVQGFSEPTTLVIEATVVE